MSDDSKIVKDIGDALSQYDLYTWLWVAALSLWGGTANFFRKLKAGAVRPFNFVEFIGEIFISGFVGVLTFFFCEAAKISPLVSAALIAISGHMGSRALFLFEQMWANRLTPGINANPKTFERDEK